jgi:hypothetical protein
VYVDTGNGQPAIFGLDSMTDVEWTTIFLHGNYDTVHGSTMWDPSISSHALPNSLYLNARPSWWSGGAAWPWVGPDLTPMVGTLPAYSRAQSM